MAQHLAIPTELAARADRWLGGGAWSGNAGDAMQQPWIAICASRIGRRPQRLPHVFSLLRATLLRSRRTRCTIVWCADTAVDHCVQRAVQLLRVPALRLRVCEWGETHDPTPTPSEVAPASLPTEFRLGVQSLTVGRPQHDPRHPLCPLDHYPRRDCAAVGLADEVVVLHVRRGGAIERLVGARLQESPARAASVRVPASLATGRNLMKQGAVGWWAPVAGQRKGACEGPTRAMGIDERNGITLQQWAELRSLDESEHWPYVVHCTRAAAGSTPGFSGAAQLDQLILGEPVEDGTALANLVQILRSGRLRSTRQLTRSEQAVVCFSAVPLARLLQRRRFRSHLGRWDYEPYGIGVLLDRLRQLGGKPVTYIDADQAAKTDPSDGTFLQPRGRSYDWTEEREWRLVGDLSLSRLQPANAFVFVADHGEVPRVRPWTDLPIIVCGRE